MSTYEEQLAQMNEYSAQRQAKEAGEQGSPEWLADRLGHVTASNFRHVMDVTKAGKPTAKRDTYLWQVVIERLTGQPTEHYVNAAMEHGTEMEPLARIAYESRTGNMVAETGFLHHKTIHYVGGSPDGLVNDDGLIEIKCPTTATMCKMLVTQDISEYVPQMQGLMWVTGRVYCDFVCFDNRLPAGLELYIQRVPRDDDYIAELAGNVLKFLGEVDDLNRRLLSLKVASPLDNLNSPSTSGNPAAPSGEAFDIATQI